MHVELEINLTKVTHAGRNCTVKTMHEHNADQDDTKKLGLWDEGAGAYQAVYDHGLPLKGLLAAAMFDADRPEYYSLPRAMLCKLWFLLYHSNSYMKQSPHLHLLNHSFLGLRMSSKSSSYDVPMMVQNPIIWPCRTSYVYSLTCEL